MDWWCRVWKWPPTLYTKDRVYKNSPQTIGDLKTAVTARIRAIPIEECVGVIDSFACHLQVCLQRQGGHLEHILDRTWKSDYLTYKTGSFVKWSCTTEVSLWLEALWVLTGLWLGSVGLWLWPVAVGSVGFWLWPVTVGSVGFWLWPATVGSVGSWLWL